MKCKMNKIMNSPVILILSVALILGGFAFYKITDASGLAARMAGFVTGFGSSIAMIWLFFWARKKIISREKFEDEQREMQDERGQMVNLKATTIVSYCAVAGVMVMTVAAVWQGNKLFMALGTVSCFAIAIGGAVSRWWYNKTL